ncbi:MAG: DNA-directed RNA polymerase subunit alpha C-terminal domain-containing protein [Planctomycetia bacterium]|nr:DNA-directed RNA polymerase subunit alpha C-terminal domain-containing protein [Planctomycetia bacterium]
MGTRIRLNPAEIQRKALMQKLTMSTAEIGLSVRTTNCLDEQGITSVEDLLNCNRADLLSIPNFGEKTLEEVYAALERLGFYRKGHTPAEPEKP